MAILRFQIHNRVKPGKYTVQPLASFAWIVNEAITGGLILPQRPSEPASTPSDAGSFIIQEQNRNYAAMPAGPRLVASGAVAASASNQAENALTATDDAFDGGFTI